MEKITVRTTQHVTVDYELASVGDRILATLIDWLVMGAFSFVLTMIMAFAIGGFGGNNNPWFIVPFSLLFLPILFYHLISEIWMNGQSIGKKARDIKVIKMDGTSPSVGDYLLRWILRLIDISICYGLVAIVAIAAGGKGQRLGDMAAGTTVVKLRRKAGVRAPVMPVAQDHQVTFPQVTYLSDEDIAMAKKLLYKAEQTGNFELLHALAQRIKDVTGITTHYSDQVFLQTVIADYTYLTSQ